MNTQHNTRLISLDVFRGLTVALMILVNNPGSWSHIYWPLEHAEWNGWTPTDLVFPFFLFIVGTALSLSFGKRVDAGASRKDLFIKLGQRSFVIFGIGLFLNGFPFNIPLNAEMAENFSFFSIFERFQTIRIMGVLQRIALAYFFAGSIILLFKDNQKRILATLVFVLVYELLMHLPLVDGWGAGSFEKMTNFGRYIDLAILGADHMYKPGGVPFDPEGLLSTLPAVATTIFGYFAGEIFRDKTALMDKIKKLLIYGAIFSAIGFLMDFVEPVNKRLWTTSYVVLMAGFSFLTLAFSTWFIDVKGWNKGFKPAIVFGSNPLVVFAGSGILGRIMYMVKVGEGASYMSIKGYMYIHWMVPLAGELNGSLLFALLNVAFWTGILWILYEKKIFIKV
jgi:predicted acyltransferase